MCGRFTLTSPTDELAGYFDVLATAELPPRYNIAPTQPVACVRHTGEARELAELRWGLIPYWAKDPSIGNRMINARAETVAEKPAYREPFRRRRCLVVADGFYEWRKMPGGPKQPYYITLGDHEPFGFAGIWDRWRPRTAAESGEPVASDAGLPLTADGRVESCSLITTRPNELLEPIHDRMPVIVPPERWNEWLAPDPESVEILLEILQPFPADTMRAYPVSTRVNKPAHDDPECIRPLPTVRVARPDPRPRERQGDLFEASGEGADD